MPPMERINQQFLKAYDRYANAIFRYCYFRIGNKEDAEELMQEVFVKSWKFLADGGTIETMQAFLYRVARNSIVDFTRKRKEVASLETLQERGFEPGHDHRKRLNNRLDSESALSALARLHTKDREILTMRYIDGLQPKEMAVIMGVSVNVVSVRIHRAKKRMLKIAQI